MSYQGVLAVRPALLPDRLVGVRRLLGLLRLLGRDLPRAPPRRRRPLPRDLLRRARLLRHHAVADSQLGKQ